MQSEPKTKRWHPHTRRWLFGALAAAGFGALAVAVFLPSGGRTGAAEPAIPLGAPPSSWSENGQDGRHLLQIADGNALPVGVTVSGVVVSDTQCAPDAQGFSHCRNAIELANGVRITVIDTHMMSRHPCLEPGQRLSLSGINSSWIMGVSL
jgi:hypothetical protein